MKNGRDFKNNLKGRGLYRTKSIIIAALIVAVAGISVLFLGETDAEASGIARSVIVQLNGEPAAVWKARQLKAGNTVSDQQLQDYRASITASQNAFLNDLSSRGINYTIDGVDIKDFNGATQMRADYRFNLVLNAVTLVVPGSAIDTLRSMPQVKSVKANDYLQLQLNKSVPYINAPAVYGQYPEILPTDDFREGFEGQGINVAVLDTGIDWAHQMFGGDPTPPRLGIAPPTAAANSNRKVVYYLSFTGGLIDDYGHGTAAASNIAGYLGMAPGADGIPATADDIRVHGVAPQAKLMGYKVCLGVGSCLSASTILGIEDAVSPFTLTMQPKPVAHVINLSLGGSGGPDSDTAIASDNAALLGTVVVASAGNSGPGEGTIGAPSAGRHVISVGATTDPAAANTTWSADVLAANAIPSNFVGAFTPANNLAANSNFNRIRLYKMAGSPDPAPLSVAQKYVSVNLATLGAMYPANVSGRIALIKDSGLASATFFDICNSAALNGAIAAILISETTNPTAVNGLIPCSIVAPNDGDVLLDAMSSTDNNAVDPPNGAISEFPLRLNPFLTNVFMGQPASFSSRGPVLGLGQVKPDVTAPGVAITSATVRVGLADANGGTMFDPTGYTPASGTSFSGPHAAGMAALVKQAHLNWTPDMVRTAMINTSTNLRSSTGTPKADGETADSVNDQGGGLINVAAAVNTKALMGVEADGIVLPGILGSHSFGERAVLNNRIINTFDVTVTIRDVSGQGGTYSLSTANNRSTNQPGVSTTNSVSSVSVPAGGSATFTTSISIDGNVIRSTDIQQFQWYVIAQNGSNKLRMPMYLQATPSLPGDEVGSSVTTTYTGTVLAGDGGVQRDNEVYLLGDTTYVDVPFTITPSDLKVNATLTWDYTDIPAAGVGLPDLDFLLFDPNGTQIGSSGNSSGPEYLSANTTIPGTYIYRVYGWANVNTDFTVTSTLLSGTAAPTVQAFASDFTQGGTSYDFDGNVTVNWTPQGTPLSYEIEQSTNGGPWTVVATPAANANSASISLANGAYAFRMRAITPGRVGKYVTVPSNVQSITVSKRVQTDATDSVSLLNRSISFPAGSAEVVSALKNTSATIFYPHITLEIVSIQSAGNSVRVANADNGGNGVTSVAAFDYSQLVGSDFIAGEESGNKTLRFSNPNTVLFTFTARVKANVAAGGGNSATPASQSKSIDSVKDDNEQSAPAVGLPGPQLLRFTVNPLTGTISLVQ
jgi:subtilisin family serine protease